jgi:hypothetical protein
MQTVELRQDTWAARLNEFAAIHEGWLVSLDVIGPRVAVRPAIREMPLLGISLSHAEDGYAVTISLARSPAEHVTHVVDRVTRILLNRTEEGADASLEIESTQGTSTVLRLRVAILPECVDYVLHP